jgi:hypothetical protein
VPAIFSILVVTLVAVSCQPHPTPLTYTINANATCKSSNTVCEMHPFSVCLLLDYFPTSCKTGDISTVVAGACPLAGVYPGTVVSLASLNRNLPFDKWALNLTGFNPLVSHVQLMLSPLLFSCGAPADDCQCMLWTSPNTLSKEKYNTQQCGSRKCEPETGCSCY